ncbi:hypothetical protein ACSFBX_13435 [Variovorax sp. RB2P76]
MLETLNRLRRAPADGVQKLVRKNITRHSQISEVNEKNSKVNEKNKTHSRFLQVENCIFFDSDGRAVLNE